MKPRKVRAKTTLPKGTVYDAISFGGGFGGRYFKRILAGKHENGRLAFADPTYRKKRGQPAVKMAVKQGITIMPYRITTAIQILKKRGVRTERITLDMPGALTRKELQTPTHKLYNFEVLFKEAKNLLVPNGRIFVTTEDPKLMLKLIGLALMHGLKVAGMHPYNKETPNAAKKSEWIGKTLEKGHTISRGVFVLPLTKTHTKQQRREMNAKR